MPKHVGDTSSPERGFRDTSSPCSVRGIRKMARSESGGYNGIERDDAQCDVISRRQRAQAVYEQFGPDMQDILDEVA